MSDLPNANPASRGAVIMDSPDQMRKVRDLFGIDSDMEVPAFSEADERVPALDPAHAFDPATTLAIGAALAPDRRARPAATGGRRGRRAPGLLRGGRAGPRPRSRLRLRSGHDPRDRRRLRQEP